MIHKIRNKLVSCLRFVYYALISLPRDIYGLLILSKIERRLATWEKSGDTVSKVFYKFVQKHPDKPCIICEGRIWTFKDVEYYSNQVACVFSGVYRLKKGDAVALFMENRPEFICIWLGLSKIGVITALINTNLKTLALVHSINIAKSKVVVYSTELTDTINQIRDNFINVMFVNQGSTNQTNDALMEDLIKVAPTEPFTSLDPISTHDTMLYIYTSGTTGLPKPAIIKHSRFLGAGYSFFLASRMKVNDIMYNCLPMYHANGGMIGTGLAIVCGVTMVLRKKFSASNFWKDCIENKCTATIYVGELCRYLVNQPPSEYDKKHNVRIAIGNGMRANIWSSFVERFGVRPYEFYASSEGNCTLINLTSKPGACGFVPIYQRYFNILPLKILKVSKNMDLIRDKNGLCVLCDANEKGIAVGIIGNKTSRMYSGYANNKDASEKKIIKNVLKRGQDGFNSDDLLMCDEYGFVYFCDRLGDSYRWKGENVSTVEVENIISSKINSTEVVVYGVQLPGHEGTAGMAAIVCTDIDIEKLSNDLKINLPSYARPIFIRLVEDVGHTSSFKAQKNQLVDVAYNIDLVKDKIYYFDLSKQKYVILTKEVFDAIQKITIKL